MEKRKVKMHCKIGRVNQPLKDLRFFLEIPKMFPICDQNEIFGIFMTPSLSVAPSHLSNRRLIKTCVGTLLERGGRRPDGQTGRETRQRSYMNDGFYVIIVRSFKWRFVNT
jgi:hypothetical protein